LDHLESANSLNSSPQLTVRREGRHKTTRLATTARRPPQRPRAHVMPTRRANTRAFVAAVAACALTAAFAAPAPTTPRNPAAPREAVPSSLPRPTRAVFPSPRAFPPLGADRDRALPSGGETAPGAPDPLSVPFRQTPTYHPAYVPGGYASLGPHASRVATATVSAGFGGDFLYGFRSVVAVYPSALDRDDAPRHPIVAWGSGAHNSCGHVDNVEVMTHLASWGFVALCPETFPEPYPGDERALLGAMLWALHRDDDPSSMLHRRVSHDGLGMAGYSLGGGRIVRGLADAHSRRRSDGDGLDGFDGDVPAPGAAMTTFPAIPATVPAIPATVFRVNASTSADVSIRPRSGRASATCVDVACVASLCGAAVTLQGWNEGPGGGFRAPFLSLTTDDDPVAGPWSETQLPVFEAAGGAKLMGVIAAGGHNLGPHYWLGWTVAFLLSQLTGDDDARRAVWGTPGPEGSPPFAGHPNVARAWRRFEGAESGRDVETFRFVDEEDEEACGFGLGALAMSC